MSASNFGGGLFRGRRLLAIAVAALVAAAGGAGAGAATHKATASAPVSIVAQVKTRSIRVYHSGARKPFLTLRNPNAEGSPLVFLVQHRVRGWVKVYLPVRPNGGTGWVRASSVNLALNTYRVVVSLGAHHIYVYKRNHRIISEQAGVGRSVLPTPSGTYFIVSLLKQPNPHGAYGPYAFGLSAYSDVLQSFGGGPGEVGLHGTDFPQGLGTNVSHGCIRISNAGVTRFARPLPLGRPVVIKR